jgi:hypothetical protein
VMTKVHNKCGSGNSEQIYELGTTTLQS